MIRKTLVLVSISAAMFGCARVHEIQQKRENNQGYVKPFYSRYLNASNPTDRQILAKMEALRANPSSASTHNDLGSLLLDRGFPKDAEIEFHRALVYDSRYYPAWYNLGVLNAAAGNHLRAIHDFNRSLSLKPGNAAAHFQLGLLYEKRGNTDEAVTHYARAFQINHALLDVRRNPRILDTRLVELALIRMYPDEHARRSIQLQVSSGITSKAAPLREPEQAASPQAAPENIVTPAPAVTEPAVQTPPPNRAPAPAPPAVTPPPQQFKPPDVH